MKHKDNKSESQNKAPPPPRLEEVTVEEVSWQQEEGALMAVRTEVFVVEQQVPPELERDEWDERCRHVLARDRQGEAVGCARLLPNGFVGRMAVRAPWRRRGVGRMLLRALVLLARQQNFARVHLNAQIDTRPFYAREGFRAHGPIFEEAGILHQQMSLDLSSDLSSPTK